MNEQIRGANSTRTRRRVTGTILLYRWLATSMTIRHGSVHRGHRTPTPPSLPTPPSYKPKRSFRFSRFSSFSVSSSSAFSSSSSASSSSFSPFFSSSSSYSCPLFNFPLLACNLENLAARGREVQFRACRKPCQSYSGPVQSTKPLRWAAARKLSAGRGFSCTSNMPRAVWGNPDSANERMSTSVSLSPYPIAAPMNTLDWPFAGHSARENIYGKSDHDRKNGAI